MGKDISHLIAIQERLAREVSRFDKAAGAEKELRGVWVEQAKSELAAEYKFLGMEPEVVFQGSDDELLAELMA